MLPAESEDALRRFLSNRGVCLDPAGLAPMVQSVLDFYQDAPAVGLAACRRADMLLFQYGVYDWGEGEHFEIGITRQFIIDGEEDDDALSQLSCTVLYDPTPVLRSIARGDRWCETRSDMPGFKSFILSSAAYVTALPLSPMRVEIDWSPV